MLFSGIDLHKRSLVIHTLGADGTTAREAELKSDRAAVMAYFGTLAGPHRGRSYGSYSGNDGWVILRRYYQEGVSQARNDSFAVGDRTLTRVRHLRGQTIQERYSPLR